MLSITASPNFVQGVLNVGSARGHLVNLGGLKIVGKRPACVLPIEIEGRSPNPRFAIYREICFRVVILHSKTL